MKISAQLQKKRLFDAFWLEIGETNFQEKIQYFNV